MLRNENYVDDAWNKFFQDGLYMETRTNKKGEFSVAVTDITS